MDNKLLKYFDWIMILAFSIIIILVVGMALLRYVFSIGLMGGSEMGRFIFIFTSSIGMGILLKRDEHIKVDIVLNLIPVMIRKFMIILNNLMIAVLNAFFIYLSINWIDKTGMTKNEVFRFPMKYIQIFLPIGFLLVVLFALSNIYDNIIDIQYNRYGSHKE